RISIVRPLLRLWGSIPHSRQCEKPLLPFPFRRPRVMSERTHSPEGTPQGQTVGEFTTDAQVAPESRPVPAAGKKRFSRKKKLAFLAGGTIALAVTAIGLFQVLKQDLAAAETGNQAAQQAGPTNGGTRRPLARVGKQVIPWEV